MTNMFQPLQASQWTSGRWQIGSGQDAHELTSGDVIDFVSAGSPRRGRVEHDDVRGYVVIPSAGGSAVLMVSVREARYIGR